MHTMLQFRILGPLEVANDSGLVDLGGDLRTVTSRIRPDWDLSKPGLREAWEAGDFSLFLLTFGLF